MQDWSKRKIIGQKKNSMNKAIKAVIQKAM
jgi:hypothetical protein